MFILSCIKDKNPIFKVFHGKPTDKIIKSDSETLNVYNILMDSLESGRIAYEERRSEYDKLIKD